MRIPSYCCAVLILTTLSFAAEAPAPGPRSTNTPAFGPNPKTAEDHKDMMQQLGITKLRPGPSGRAGATNEANYDEAKANPFPDLPDPLTLKNGQKVTTPEIWWNQRRPEIIEDFEREVYGRIPPNVPKVAWNVVS